MGFPMISLSGWSNLKLVGSFKGNMSPDEYFLTAYKIKSILSLHAQMVFKFLACLFLQKNQNKVFAFFFENTY